MPTLAFKKQDPTKKSPPATAPKTKMAVTIKPKAPVDSLKMTDDLLESPAYKGKKFDSTKGGHKTIKSLVGDYVVPEIKKYNERADSLYDFNKAKNPDYPGASARELDPITGGKGKHLIAHAKVYKKYRDATDLRPEFVGTEQGQKDRVKPSFGGGSDYSKEDLYVPDDNLRKKKPATMAIKKKTQ